jgi:hypothetical protein
MMLAGGAIMRQLTCACRVRGGQIDYAIIVFRWITGHAQIVRDNDKSYEEIPYQELLWARDSCAVKLRANL